MRMIFDSAYGKVYEDADKRFLVFARGSTTARSAEEMAQTIGEVADFVEGKFAGYGAVFDLRAVPGTNDPDIHAAAQPALRRIRDQFERRIILVRTAAGVLQVQRVARENNDAVVVTMDEDKARQFAAGLIDADQV